MTGGNVINRPKKALQKNLNKLNRVKKAQRKKQQGISKKGGNLKTGVALSAKKKRLLLKQLKKQEQEKNKMEVVAQEPSQKTVKEENVTKVSKTEKMDTS